MPLASNLCQALTQLVLVQRVCCARSDKTFHFSSRVWYYTDKRTCMKIFLSKSGFLYPLQWFCVRIYSLHLSVRKQKFIITFFVCYIRKKAKIAQYSKTKQKTQSEKNAFDTQQRRKMANDKITRRILIPKTKAKEINHELKEGTGK